MLPTEYIICCINFLFLEGLVLCINLICSYNFTAQTTAERDDWVSVINAASKVRKDHTFKVVGQLSVDGMKKLSKE